MVRKVAVLISGSGTNLQALIDACQQPDFPAEIVLVLSNKAGAYGLTRAKEAGIETAVVSLQEYDSRQSCDQKMHELITASGAELVCLAGFMRLLTPEFTQKWHGKMLNIHPSLLPAFKGVDGPKQALEYGVKIAGCSVHFVVAEMDAGPIILQESVPVLASDTAGILAARILEKEHQAYVKALRLVAEDRVKIEGNRAVII